MKLLRRLRIAVVLSVCALVLISCGKSEKITDNANVKPKYGGTLVYTKNSPPVTLDPALTTETESTIPCDNIFDPLVQLKLGKTGIAPALAKTWDISKDGLVYTFHLRTGVTFHDGTPFNAKAVLFSFNRQRDPKHPFHQGGDKFEYWKNFSMNEMIKDINAVNDSTVQFTLSSANATFLYILSMQFTAIVSPDGMKKYGAQFYAHPIGTGAFHFVSWQSDDNLILAANTDYWDGRPYLDTLIFKAVNRSEERVSRLLSGEYDMIESPTPEKIAEIENDKNLKVFKQPGVNIAYMAMNMSKKPFSDERVRQAVVYAVNREKLVEKVYGEFGRPAKNPIPPMLLGYNEEIRFTPYDPEKAKQLLTEAGFPGGFKTKLWYMPIAREYMPDGKGTAELIQTDLKAVGIEAEIATYPWHEYLEKLYKGEHEMAIMGWIADIPDPDNFFYPLLDKTVAEIVPSNNIAFYKGEEMHQLLLQGKQATDLVTRSRIYRDACAVFNRDLPWFTIAHSVVIVPMQSYVMNFQPYASYARKFNTVWLNK
ncbi:ABC transporter substrate-binding protein [bacterium]|nr:ABC transporter substrate-binding protein [bacterium]